MRDKIALCANATSLVVLLSFPVFLYGAIIAPLPGALFCDLAMHNESIVWALGLAIVTAFVRLPWAKAGAAGVAGVVWLSVLLGSGTDTARVAQWMKTPAADRAIREPSTHGTEFWVKDKTGWRRAFGIGEQLYLAEALKLGDRVYLATTPGQWEGKN